MNPNPYMEFSLTETGGGCQALMANHFGVTYMITDSGDPSAPRDGQPVDLGVYFDDAGYLDGNYAYFGTFVNLGYAKTMSAMIAAKLATATENERATWSIVAADPGLHADDIVDQGGSQEAAAALVEQGFIDRHANGTYSPVISSPADYRGNDYGIDEPDDDDISLRRRCYEIGIRNGLIATIDHDVLDCELATVVGARCFGLIVQANALLVMLDESEARVAVIEATARQCAVWMHG